jgi:hypothetical protein
VWVSWRLGRNSRVGGNGQEKCGVSLAKEHAQNTRVRVEIERVGWKAERYHKRAPKKMKTVLGRSNNTHRRMEVYTNNENISMEM